jgi:DNA-binding NtrC family response regulator
VIDAEGVRIEARHIMLDRMGTGPAAGPAPAVRPWSEVEKELILATLAHVGGNRKRAAELIGIGERTLRNRLRAYRVEAQIA